MTIKVISTFINYQKELQKSDRTLQSYQSDLQVFAQWFKENNNETLSLVKITPTDVRHFKRYLIDSGFKPSTISRKLLSIKYLLEWGWQTKRIQYRFPLPKLLKQVPSAPKWLKKTEQHALVRHFEQIGLVRDLAIVKILLNTGLRVQELCNLKWSDIKLFERKGSLIVRNSKGEKYRTVPLNKDARNAFQSLNYQNYKGSDKFVFQGQRGPLTPRGVQLMLNRHISKSNLSHISPHQLRHTFCKNLVNANVSLEKVALLAGHEKLDTTKIYCKPSQSDLNDAVSLIGEEE